MTTCFRGSTAPTWSSVSATTPSSMPLELWNPTRQLRIVAIDTQPAEVDASYQAEVELVGDIGRTLDRLLDAIGSDASDRTQGLRRTHGLARCAPCAN